MKNDLLRLLIMISKNICYGLMIQIFTFSMLFATDGKAQYESVKETRITLHLKDVTLIDAIQAIESKTSFKFTFEEKDLAGRSGITVKAEDQTLEEVLLDIGKTVRVYFKQVNDNIHVKPVRQEKTHKMTEVLQEVTVRGKVTDLETGEPLPGVNVIVKGTSNGTVTDVDGNYNITANDNTATLVFSYIGYVPEEVNINGRTVIDIVLSPDIQSLQEVVVVGYGTQQKSDLTGSVSSIEAEELAKIPSASFNQSLMGKAAGVQVVTESGAPGAGLSIKIRGINSIQGNNEPLYVIDGFPISAGIQGGTNQSRNPLAGINPNDIKSIEILKDASATAIYGSRGANGVVLVTTKQGKAGKAKINFDAYYGMQEEIGSYDVLNGREFAQLYNEAVANSVLTDQFTYSQEAIDSIGQGTNWRDAVLEPAPIQNYQLSVSGGNEKLKYYVSGNYFDQEGIITGSGFDRASLRLNLDGELTEKLTFGSNLTLTQAQYSGAFGNSQQSNFSGGYIDVYYAPPTFPIYNPDGIFFQTNPLSAFPFPNPVENATAITRDQTNLRALGSFFGAYQFVEGLTLKVTLGADIVSDNISQYLPAFTARSNFQGEASKSHVLTKTWLNTNTLTYNKTLNERHDMTFLLGHELQHVYSESFGGTSTQFSNDLTGYYSLQAGELITGLNSGAYETALQSFFGRANYVFDNKYLLTFTARLDGSSKFQGDNKYSFFPSGAIAWRLSEEQFIRDLDVFDDLKFRASYGITGSQAIDPYQTLDLIGATNQVTIDGVGTTLAYYPQRLPSPGLRWETTEQYDIGVDMGFFKNRLNFTADYYHKVTDNLLLDVDLPLTTGFESVTQNVGSMKNTGIELSFNSRNVVGEFEWSTNFNIAFVQNEVLSLGDREFLLVSPGLERAEGSSKGGATAGIIQVGEPFGSFYVLQEDGIIDDEEELNSAPTYPGIQIGKRSYVDIDTSGTITPADRTIVGNAQPDFIGGITNNFSYKGFDLSIFFEYSYGNEIYNATRFTLERPSLEFNVTREFYENRWTGPGTSTTYPQAIYGQLNLAPSESYIEDGSYLRLKNISLGYNLQPDVLEFIGLSQVRIYASATNLWTLTNYSGIDPNVNVFGGYAPGIGIDYSGYPTAKTYTVGLTIGL